MQVRLGSGICGLIGVAQGSIQHHDAVIPSRQSPRLTVETRSPSSSCRNRRSIVATATWESELWNGQRNISSARAPSIEFHVRLAHAFAAGESNASCVPLRHVPRRGLEKEKKKKQVCARLALIDDSSNSPTFNSTKSTSPSKGEARSLFYASSLFFSVSR